MTARQLKCKIEQVSAEGRIRLFSNAWFDVHCTHPALKPGRVYNMIIDDTLRSVSEIRELSDRTQADRLESLYFDEISRLESIIGAYQAFIAGNNLTDELDLTLSELAGQGKISLDSFKGELSYRENNLQATRETGQDPDKIARSGKVKGFQTYRDDCRNERLRANQLTAEQARAWKA